MRYLLIFVCAAALGTITMTGCSETNGDGGNGGAAGMAGTGGAGGTAGGGGAGGSGGTAGGGGEGGQGGTTPSACPDPTGQFNITASNCGDLDISANQRIMMTATVCTFEFISGVPSGPLGLNGPFPLDMAGTFSGVTLQVGSSSVPGCSGSWVDPMMTVTCGDCMVTLDRR